MDAKGRKARLAAELRANLARRKASARLDGAGDARQEPADGVLWDEGAAGTAADDAGEGAGMRVGKDGPKG